MILKLGHKADIAQLPDTVDPVVKQHIYKALTLLDDEYGYNRDVDFNDGGFVIFCFPGTWSHEINKFFRYEQHVPEWCKQISDDYCSALFITDNEYSVELIIPIFDATEQLLSELERK